MTRTSNCPIDACATCALFVFGGNVLGVTVSGTCRVRPNPNFAACWLRASAPRVMPRLPNAVLQEIRSAFSSVTWPPGPQGCRSSFGRVIFVCGSGSSAGPGIRVSGLYRPVESAVALVMSLKVEPGGYCRPAMARLSSGRSGSASSRL